MKKIMIVLIIVLICGCSVSRHETKIFDNSVTLYGKSTEYAEPWKAGLLMEINF